MKNSQRLARVLTLAVAVALVAGLALVPAQPAEATRVPPGKGWLAFCRICRTPGNVCAANTQAVYGGAKAYKEYACPGGGGAQAPAPQAPPPPSAPTDGGGPPKIHGGASCSSPCQQAGGFTCLSGLWLDARANPELAKQCSAPSSEGTRVAPKAGGDGVSWDRAVQEANGGVFNTLDEGVKAVSAFVGRNGKKILVGSAATGGTIWLISAVTASTDAAIAAGYTVVVGAGAYVIGGLLITVALVMFVWAAITGLDADRPRPGEMAC